MRRIAAIFVVAAAAMSLIFGAAEWYADNSALPRYCSDPVAALAHVRQTLAMQSPVGSGGKRPYIVAAKLTFLVPRNSGEAIEPYLNRLRQRIEETCLFR